MNILIVVPWYKPVIGGVVYAVEKVCKALKEAGHNVIILIPGDSKEITPTGVDGDVQIYEFNFRSPYSAKYPIRSLVAYLAYPQPLSSENF